MIMPQAAINTDTLLKYLDGSLNDADRVAVQEALAADPFLSDALEGLGQVPDKQQLEFVVAQLNAQLRRQVSKRRQRRRKPLQQPLWMYVLLILLLAVLCWLALKAVMV